MATSDDPIHTAAQTYKSLKINGPLSVVPVTPEDVKGETLFVDILMGATEQELHISKDSLEGVTQHVTCYRVINLGHQLYNTSYILMDTPGFLDPRLPESRIMTMITQKLDDLRISVSKRDALKLLRASAGSLEDTAVTVVTTMWNHTSHPKRMEDASRQFRTLSDEFFPVDRRPIKVTKFEFSTDSALHILDGVHGRCHHIEDTSQNMDPQYQSLIHMNLLGRISSIQQQLLTLAEDKQSAITPGREDPLLLEIVLRDEKVALVQELLLTFTVQHCLAVQ
ncbi:hypothetical protein BJ165DRAFT_1410423 [Panaeolus papilionaceus]|nr:hypothetical protein BJ165DRAFT_1410423 [Panaeolus papilionaceus]